MNNLLKALLVASIFLVTSCSSQKDICFSDETWSFSGINGDIVNSDSTMRFRFGDHVLDSAMTIISCRDSLSVHKGAEKYLAHILKVCGLENSTVYFYAPLENTMWVELPKNYRDVRPAAVSFNLNASIPGTSWIWDDDVPEGDRKPDEIYSNTFADKRNGTLIVVDKLLYGSTPMACLHIFQSSTPKTIAMGFQPWYWTSKGNLLDHTYDDILANWIDSRRDMMFANYRSGQNVEYRRRQNTIRTELKEILRLDQKPRNRIVAAWQEHPQDTVLHQQIGREIWRNDSINLIRVCEILENYNLDFGEENEILWAVIQHSTLELQQKYLPKFISAAKQRKIRGELIPVMQDRIACQSGKLQLYGSQGNIDKNGIFVPAPISDPENVDKRRASMGMCTLQEYIDIMSHH